MYYGRHFRSADGTTPPIMGPLLQGYGSISVLTLPADNGTWGIGVIASAADKAMRGLRDTERWTALVASLPLAAHWLDGEPLERRRRRHGQDRGPAPQLHRGRGAGGDRGRRGGGLVGVHQPVAGARCLDRDDALPGPARHAARVRARGPRRLRRGVGRRPRRPRSSPGTGPRCRSTGTAWPRSTHWSPARRTGPTATTGPSSRACSSPRARTPTASGPRSRSRAWCAIPTRCSPIPPCSTRC